MTSPSYYVKALDAGQPSSRLDYSAYEGFDFRKRVHDSNRMMLANILKDSPNFIPDVAAAALAQLQSAGLINIEGLLKSSLYFCHDTLLDSGYQASVIEYVRSGIAQDNVCAMLVAGCQDRGIYESRVRAAYETIRQLGSPFRLVFSGLNPAKNSAGSRVRIVNEAREMHSYFNALRSQDPSGASLILDTVSELDEQATNTKTNIEGFFQGNFLDSRRRNQVFVATSTFHLPRLSRSIDEYFQATPELTSHISRIVLVGSEGYNLVAEVPTLTRYLKSMMHEIFFTLFSQDH